MDDKQLEDGMRGTWFGRHFCFPKIREGVFQIGYRKHWWESRTKYLIYDRKHRKPMTFETEESAANYLFELRMDVEYNMGLYRFIYNNIDKL